jgi:penicillin amidase
MITSEETVVLRSSHLHGRLQIVRDRFGLEHIYAQTEADLFFGQGFNVARARLWQIDLWRRRGLGLLAEVLGPGFVAQDRASRIFLYSGDAEVEWASYPSGTREACENFCHGINAFVERVRRGEEPLPREFEALNFGPSLWCPADIVAIRNNTLTTNAVSELKRLRLLQNGHAGVDRLRGVLRPFTPPLHVDRRIGDLDRMIALLTLSTAPVLISRERLEASMEEIEKWADPAVIQGASVQMDAVDGSNNWAIGASRTATGAPILANDPHRALQTPSLRYAVHLHCPSFSVVGAGEPALPGISIGHNGAVGFGLTIFPADQEDIFCFNVDGGNANALSSRRDIIPIKGKEPVSIERRWFQGSPVIKFEEESGCGVAVRTVWSEPGASPYLGSIALLKVKSVAEFRSALKDWRLPAVNYVAADRSGSIGWFVAGAIPKRKGGFGLLPTTCTSDPWVGFLLNEDLPTKIDPPDGYVMSANEFNLPDDWNSGVRPVAFEWYEEFRARRIHEQLRQEQSATIAGSIALQDDATSLAARDLLKILVANLSKQALTKLPEPAKKLLAWDCYIDNEKPESIFFIEWFLKCLKPAVLSQIDDTAPVGCLADISTEATIAALVEFEPETRRRILIDTLMAAASQFSDDHFRPRRVLFRHAIQDGAIPGESFSPRPDVWPGDDTTVRFGKSGARKELIEFGASFRMVLDLADWDNSQWSNVPDQSRSEEGGTVAPLLFSPEAVERHTDFITNLLPELHRNNAKQ